LLFLLRRKPLIALFAQEKTVQDRLANANEVFLSSIVIGEMYYGAYKSSQVAENTLKIEEFAAANTVLVCDIITAQTYGQIKNDLRVKGRPIPENDIWIGAIAKQHNLTVATRDDHFKEIDGLDIEMW